MKFRILVLIGFLAVGCSTCTQQLGGSITEKQPFQTEQLARIADGYANKHRSGKQPAQAKALARIAVGYAKLDQQIIASTLLAPAVQTAKVNSSVNEQQQMWQEIGVSYVKMTRYEQAAQAAKSLSLQVKEGFYKDRALGEITKEMIAAEQYDRAAQVAQLISRNGVQIQLVEQEYTVSQSNALIKIAQGLTAAKQNKKALLILAQALGSAKTDSMITEVAVEYANMGQKDKALRLLSQISQKANSIINIADLAVKYAQVGQKDKASRMLARTLQITKNQAANYYQANPLDLFAYFDLMKIATSYAAIGQCSHSIEIAKAIKAYPNITNEPVMLTLDGAISGTTPVDVFAKIASKCAETGQFNLALQAIKESKWVLNKPPLLAQLAVEQATKQQYSQAFESLKNVNSDSYKAKALIKIIENALQTEQNSRVFPVLMKAVEVAKSINDDESKTLVLAALGTGYAEVGRTNQADMMLAQALQNTEEIHR